MSTIENSRELAENKLILLYIIHNLESPVTNLLITKIILENKLMNYIFLQQYLDELCEGKFLMKIDSDEKLSYSISPAGKQSLEYFTSLIPAGIKSRIDVALSDFKKHKKNEISIQSDFVAVNEHEYIANLKITEGNFTYIDLKMSVGSRNDAKKICNNWGKNSEKLYNKILSALTENNDETT
jgi:predicted transcriptional regulator